MKKGIKIVMEFRAQDPASKDFMKLQDMIDAAMKEAVNEPLTEIERLLTPLEIKARTLTNKA